MQISSFVSLSWISSTEYPKLHKATVLLLDSIESLGSSDNFENSSLVATFYIHELERTFTRVCVKTDTCTRRVFAANSARTLISP